MLITLIGSKRFGSWYYIWDEALSVAGHSVSFNPDDIKNSDTIMCLNVFAYIGVTTMEQINYTMSLNKQIIFLESWGKGNGIDSNFNNQIINCAIKFGVYPNHVSLIDTHLYSNPWSTKILGPSSKLRNDIVNKIKLYESKVKNKYNGKI